MDNLNLGPHISQQFNAELEDIRNKVLEMGGIVEDQVGRAVRALVEGDTKLAKQVVEDDYRVNALEVEIDEECTRIVARRQPAASDLRLVMAVIKTISDLERIGDEAKRVARMVEDELNGAMAEDVRNELEHMGDLVRDMLRMILDAFARTDVETAVQIVELDHRVDTKYVSITRQLITYMAQDPKNSPGDQHTLGCRAMERIGDRCGTSRNTSSTVRARHPSPRSRQRCAASPNADDVRVVRQPRGRQYVAIKRRRDTS
jgi:phosphate transport system protein